MSALPSPIAALGSAATLGIADFSGGLAGRRTSAPSVIVGMEVCGLVALPLALTLMPSNGDAVAIVWAVVAGAVGGTGLIAFYRAMSLTLIGVVAPIAGVVGAAIPTVVGVVGGDHLHPGQLIGIAVGLAAISLINGVSRTTFSRPEPGIVLAVLAGVGFGLFFVIFHAASSAGVPAFLGARLGSVCAGLCAALLGGVSPVARRGAWPLIVLAGTFDGAGGVLYIAASRTGLLSITALLTSFYPATTVLCARLFTRERLGRLQAVGVFLAVIAVALIAAT
jgi:drug/metabolite transporter (DMT)-like permease